MIKAIVKIIVERWRSKRAEAEDRERMARQVRDWLSSEQACEQVNNGLAARHQGGKPTTRITLPKPHGVK